MFCNKCGTNLPDEAQYCHQCGTAQNPTQGVQAPEHSWETCEIVWQVLRQPQGGWLERSLLDIYLHGGKKVGEYRFWAEAIGPSGRYDAGSIDFESWWEPTHVDPRFPESKKEISIKIALDNLIRQLVSDGWEAADTRGAKWFSFRFRRRVPR